VTLTQTMSGVLKQDSSSTKPCQSFTTSPSVRQRLWFNKQEQSTICVKRQALCSIYVKAQGWHISSWESKQCRDMAKEGVVSNQKE